MSKENFIKYGLIMTASLFIFVMLVLPLILVASEAFKGGWAVYIKALTDDIAIKAMWLTLEATVAAVVFNTIFGLASAWLLTKYDFKGKSILGSIIDLPFAISPVVAGLFFIMLFGRMSPLYPLLEAEHIKIVFAVPGIILATVFVTLPFITRELVPVMEAQGRDEEEAAASMGADGWTIFSKVTFPNIKWALLYGVTLCTARAMGEFGAVSVVSGHVRGKTDTLPLHIEILYNEYNFTAAFAAASVLVIFAIIILIIRNLIEWRAKRRENNGV